MLSSPRLRSTNFDTPVCTTPSSYMPFAGTKHRNCFSSHFVQSQRYRPPGGRERVDETPRLQSSISGAANVWSLKHKKAAMASGMGSVCWSLLVLVLCFCGASTVAISPEGKTLRRNDFPKKFVFGAGTSAYQYEGAAFEDGKGVGIWDVYTHEGNTMDGSTGDVASDGYHRYKEDVKLLSDGGFDAFRFSISWPRLIPDGRGEINPKGLEFYNNFVNELLAYNIEPYVTLNHFDLPQKLEDEYGGWVHPRIVDDFLAFAEVCFRAFGDRVNHWITINEPNTFAELGYSEGSQPPKRCSLGSASCTKGNSTTEPYLALHHMLLAHSAAVKLYRSKFRRSGGSIGISISAYWYWPLNNELQNAAACQRAMDFQIGWIIEPLLYGRYPEIMRQIVGNRLPTFTESEAEDIIQSFDFIGLNHYSTLYISENPSANYPPQDYMDDMRISATGAAENQAIATYLNYGYGSVPLGFQELLEYVKERYGNPPVIITECGVPDNSSVPMSESVRDAERVSFYSDYLRSMLNAMSNGSDTRGFFAWSFVDSFENGIGYQIRFGLNYLDFKSGNLRRVPKSSMKLFKRMLRGTLDDGHQHASS